VFKPFTDMIKGFSICAVASTTGTILFKDGGAGGATVMELDIPSNTNPNSFYVLIPGEGILAETSLAVTTGSGASAIIYYG